MTDNKAALEKHMKDLHLVNTWVGKTLKDSQRAFFIVPSSTNWVAATNAMMVYQQWSQIRTNLRGGSLLAPTLDALDNIPVSQWGDAIIAAACV